MAKHNGKDVYLKKKYNEKGEELMDPTPMSLPLNFERPEPLGDKIRRLVRNELSYIAQNKGLETFDDADDFDIPDDQIDANSPYEEQFEGDNSPAINEPVDNLKKLKEKAEAAIQAVKDAASKMAEAEMATKNLKPGDAVVQPPGQPPVTPIPAVQPHNHPASNAR